MVLIFESPTNQLISSGCWWKEPMLQGPLSFIGVGHPILQTHPHLLYSRGFLLWLLHSWFLTLPLLVFFHTFSLSLVKPIVTNNLASLTISCLMRSFLYQQTNPPTGPEWRHFILLPQGTPRLPILSFLSAILLGFRPLPGWVSWDFSWLLLPFPRLRIRQLAIASYTNIVVSTSDGL